MRRTTTVVALLAIATFTLSFTSPAYAEYTAEQKQQIASYKGHRVLTWVLDADTRALRGFGEVTAMPGKVATFEPVEGHVVTITLGEVEEQEYFRGYDFDNPLTEPGVSIKVRQGTSTSERSADLTSPFIVNEYRTRDGLATVSFVAPVGTLDSKALAPLLAEPFKGEKGELEGLLMAGAREGRFDTYEILDIFTLVGKTTRRDDWVALYRSKTRGAIPAAAVLGSEGDEAALQSIARLARRTTGNRLLDVIEIVGKMPPSKHLLPVIVDLIVADKKYVEQTPPGVGVADVDRRYVLLEALVKYAPADVAPHANRLRAWAAGRKDISPQMIERAITGEAEAPDVAM